MIGILLFILPLLAGVFGTHYILYVTVARFFPLPSLSAKLLVFLVPLGLTLSLVFSALLLHLHRNFVTITYSVFSAVWVGFFIHLVMATGLVWIVYLVGRLIGHLPDMKVVCAAASVLAIVATAYGVWNAASPSLKKIDVEIAELPDNWKGRKVVHLADLHLGTIRGTGYLDELVKQVNGQEPGLILITGDLFDGMGQMPERFVEGLNRFEAARGVLFATGNHEGYADLDRCLAVLARTHIKVLDNEVVDIDGLQIVGVSFPEEEGSGKARDFNIDPARPAILLYHTPTDVEQPSKGRKLQQNRTYFAPDTDFKFAHRHGIDLQLSGHTHQGQFFPFTLVTRLIYGPYHYGLHRQKELQVYTTSGTGTWGPPIRTASKSEVVVIALR